MVRVRLVVVLVLGLAWLGLYLVLCLDLFLQLLDLMVHDLELPLHLGDLILALNQALRVEVAIGAHRLIQVLQGGERWVVSGCACLAVAAAPWLGCALLHSPAAA